MYGVVLARLQGKTPPFRPGFMVKPKKNPVAPAPGQPDHKPRELSDALRVTEVWYHGDDTWRLLFRKMGQSTTYDSSFHDGDRWNEQRTPLFFNASDFELTHPLTETCERVLINCLGEYDRGSHKTLPSHIAQQLKISVFEAAEALNQLTAAGYATRIEPWYQPTNPAPEDKNGYEFT